MRNVLLRSIKKRDGAEMSIEMALVLPVVLIVICTAIYAVFYIHDGIAIKSKSYIMAMDNSESKITGLFVTKTNPSVSEGLSFVKVIGQKDSFYVSTAKRIGIPYKGGEYSAEAQKKMDPSLMRKIKGLADIALKEKE